MSAADDRFAAEQELRQSERDLIKKYPDARIIKGSLRPGKPKDGFGTKRVVEIKCRCGNIRTLATSDVFHCHGRCQDCIRKERNAARSAANAAANGRTSKPKPKAKPAAKKAVKKAVKKVVRKAAPAPAVVAPEPAVAA